MFCTVLDAVLWVLAKPTFSAGTHCDDVALVVDSFELGFVVIGLCSSCISVILLVEASSVVVVGKAGM